MSKYDYLHALYQQLIELDIEQRSAIMRDVENKFREAEDQGLSEVSVTDIIGSPAEYAKSILSPSSDEETESDITLEAPEETIEDMIEKVEDTVNSNQDNINSSTELPDENDEEYKPSIDLSSSLIIGHDASLHKAKDLVDPQDLIDSDPVINETMKQEPRVNDTVVNESMTKDQPVQVKSNPQQIVRRRRPQTPTKYQETRVSTKNVYSSPNQISKYQSSNHPIKMMAITLGMFLFNTAFVLGPFVAVWSVVIAFIASGFALAIVGAGILISALLSIPLAFVSVPIAFLSHPILLLCFGFLVLGIGGLLSIATIYSVRFFGMLTARYAGWNVRLIRGY